MWKRGFERYKMRTYFKVEAQLSLRVEAQLSGFAKMRARE